MKKQILSMSLCSLLLAAACGPPPTPRVKPRPARIQPKEPILVPGAGRDLVELVKVPAGAFLRGSVGGRGEPDEQPQREIVLSTFYIDRFAVSVAQYRRCVEAGVCSPPEAEKLCNYAEKGRERHPVNCVSWNQSDEYCRWAGKRLPSEAEWEKAARGVNGGEFPWGDKAPNCTMANFFKHKEKRYCRGRTVPVDEYAHTASPYGAVQMAGNVYEWVADWYGKEYYRQSPAKDPRGPESGQYRGVRGGSWFSPAADMRSAMRGPLPPVMRDNYLGFRCAVSDLQALKTAAAEDTQAPEEASKPAEEGEDEEAAPAKGK